MKRNELQKQKKLNDCMFILKNQQKNSLQTIFVNLFKLCNLSGTQRSPCILRAGTREVHNKLEKNRRAHLKECFEQLKKQLPQMPEEKKISNLSILGAAIRHVQVRSEPSYLKN